VNEEQLSDEDSSESGDSYHENEEELMSEDDDEEEGDEVLPHVSGSRQGGLEWDDSTLHPALRSPKTNTYRVWRGILYFCLKYSWYTVYEYNPSSTNNLMDFSVLVFV